MDSDTERELFEELALRKHSVYPYCSLKKTRNRYIFKYFLTLYGHMDQQLRRNGVLSDENFWRYPSYLLLPQSHKIWRHVWSLVLNERAMPIPADLEETALWIASLDGSVNARVMQKMLWILDSHLREGYSNPLINITITTEILWEYVMNFMSERVFPVAGWQAWERFEPMWRVCVSNWYADGTGEGIEGMAQRSIDLTRQWADQNGI